MNGLKHITLTGLALTSLLLGGCLETLPSRPQATPAPAREPVTLRLLERQTAYRNDHKVCTRFRLPYRPHEIRSAALAIDAYNDDRRYARTLWLEIDGVGGYLAADRYQRGQYSGRGVLGAGQRKRFYVDLSDVPLSIQGRASSRVNFERLLQQEGEHTLCTWISTYGRYGPGSWVTVDLELETGRPLPPHARLESWVWYQGQEPRPPAPRPIHRFEKKSLPAPPPAAAPRASGNERSFSKQGLLKKPLPARPRPRPPTKTGATAGSDQPGAEETASSSPVLQNESATSASSSPARPDKNNKQSKAGRDKKGKTDKPCKPERKADNHANARAGKKCEEEEEVEHDEDPLPAAPSSQH